MATVIGSSEGTPLQGEFEVVIKVRSADTNGVLAVIEETIPPRRLIPPHTHQNDVWVYVLSGRIGVLVDDKIGHTESGGWALKPRNVMHAMWNPGDVPARIIEVLTPAGSEQWFEELAGLPPGDRAAFDRACARHGIHFLTDSPWTEKLRLQFNLR